MNWSKDEEVWLADNYKKLGTTACAKYLARSEYSVRKKSKRLQEEEEERPHDFEYARKRLNDHIGFYENVRHEETVARVGGYYTIAIMPCLHIPYESTKNLAQFIATCGDEVDELVIAGDFLDCLSVGHAGYKRNIRPKQYHTLKEEMAFGKATMAILSTAFPKITVMRGNHPDRVRKYFAERVPTELMFLVNYDVMSLLVADFGNVTNVSYEDKFGNDLGWIYQVGDVRICHAELGSAIEMRPSVRLDRWFREWDAHLQDIIELDSYRVLVECHTHQAGILYLNSGKKTLVEGGCLCRTQQYSLEPSVPYSHPQTNAVTFITLHNNIADIASIRQMIFDTME